MGHVSSAPWTLFVILVIHVVLVHLLHHSFIFLMEWERQAIAITLLYSKVEEELTFKWTSQNINSWLPNLKFEKGLCENCSSHPGLWRIIRAVGFNINLSDILVSLKKHQKGKKFWNTTRPERASQVGGNCLVCLYQYLTSNSNFRTTSNLQNFLFPWILLILWEKLFIPKCTQKSQNSPKHIYMSDE